MSAVHSEKHGVSIINFSIGSPTAALIIVAVGLLPMFWISRQILRVRRREG